MSDGDPCQGIIDAIDALNQEILDLGAQMDGATGPERSILMSRIANAQQRIKEEEAALRRCRANPPPQRTEIAGVEITQVIQYFNKTGQGSGFGPDNSVPLIAGRPTLLRVYLTATQYPNVGGEVGYGGVNYDQHTLRPTVQSIPGAFPPSQDRSSLDRTLDFILPATDSSGIVDLRITVYPLFAGSPADNRYWGISFARATFQDMPRMRVHGVLVHYTGPDFNDIPVDAQPSIPEFEATFASLRQTYPISDLAFTGYTVLPWSAKVAVTANFNALKSTVDQMRALDSSGDLYVALLPPVAGSGGTSGLGSNGAALSYAGSEWGVAHEVGHALGRLHAPCGGPPGVDPNYPRYPFPPASIGEYGIDLRSNTLKDPHDAFDLMSYCPTNAWISPYTYSALKDALAQEFAAASPVPPFLWAAQLPFLHLQFRVLADELADERVSVVYAVQADRLTTDRQLTQESDFTVECVTANGAVTCSWPCAQDEMCGTRNASATTVSAILPWFAESQHLHLLQSGKIIAQFPVADSPPEVALKEFRRSETGKHLVRWQSKTSKDISPAISYSIRFSHDAGQTWRALGANLDTNESLVDLTGLPGSPQCQVQVLASAGFRTSSAETELFNHIMRI